MAKKKDSGKGKKKFNKEEKAAASARKTTREKSEEKAITVDTNLANEQIAVMPDAPRPENEPVPVQEVMDELRANPQGGEEKAITVDTNLANEQIAVMPDAPRPENEPVPVQEVMSALVNHPAGGEYSDRNANPEPAKLKRVEKPEISPAGPRMPNGISPRPLFEGNPYLPRQATVMEVIDETSNIKTLRLVLDNEPGEMENFTFEPGQVGQISVFGAGEATFVINSPPSQKHYLQFSVMKVGEVTDAIHKLQPGDKVGLRAPLGNFFPYNDWKGKNVFFIGGGIGMAPIRTIMLYLLEHKQDYGKISLLYGARSPNDMAYSYELDAWMHNPDLDCTLCIDNPHEQWHHKTGLIPKVLEEINPSPDNTVAVLCGPPIMIKFTLEALKKLGFAPENIVTTLEKRMKCGIGICGRCNIGDRYVCVDGPVFTMQELDHLPKDY